MLITDVIDLLDELGDGRTSEDLTTKVQRAKSAIIDLRIAARKLAIFAAAAELGREAVTAGRPGEYDAEYADARREIIRDPLALSLRDGSVSIQRHAPGEVT